MKRWKCSVCGYIHTGETPPDKCPVCGADKSLFTLLAEAPAGNAEVISDSPKAGAVARDENKRWRCSVCGYVHQGAEPPDKCPVCGADKSQFVLIEDSAATNGTSAPATDSRSTDAARESMATGKAAAASNLSTLLTRLHGHPIAVHIPNGLLPVTVLFTLLAVILNSELFAIAARYNIMFVALTMPIVIATGIIDWKNRFSGRMTPVFRAKMICAGVVTLLSVVLVLWWMVNPEIYTAGIASNGLFLLINFVNLGTAGLAGWYGGKLVFHN